MAQEKILIVEDDKNISKLLKYNLEKAGFECVTALTGEETFQVLDRSAVDLVILDVMLPKMDGFEVCRILKQDKRYAGIPVMMLTARGEEVDRIVGLELGADDYIVKPFSPRELILRVKAVLRRHKKSSSQEDKQILEGGAIQLDVARHKVSVGGKAVILTAMEFKLLVVLMQRRGRVQSREQLLSDVWEMNPEITTRTIDTHVKRLRQKLGKYGPLVETVRGYGYRFSEEE